MGCTCRTLGVGIREHYNGTSYSRDTNLTNVSKHVKYVEGTRTLIFKGLERVTNLPRGGSPPQTPPEGSLLDFLLEY